MRFPMFGLSVLLQGCALLLLSSSLLFAAPLTVHIAPFAAGSAAPPLAEAMFDAFVDELDSAGPGQGVNVEIIKIPLTEVDPGWLIRQDWVEGTVVDYVEDVGCCSTEFKVSARLQEHLTGAELAAPLELADEAFFNHDETKLADEQVAVGDRLGRALASRWLQLQASR